MAGKRIPISYEEKVAKKLTDLVNDYNLDLNEVGKYFARVSGLVGYNRVMEIVLVAEEERERMEARKDGNFLF